MESEAFSVEEPEHKVYLNSYYLGIHEVTKKNWELHGVNLSRFEGLDLPAKNVSWPEADAYFRTLADRFC